MIDNINNLLGDDLKQSIKKRSTLKIAASSFSIYAFEALKKELQEIDSIEFIFTEATFIPSKATGNLNKKSKEFHIPVQQREQSFYGSKFEILLRNKLNQHAIAKECAEWIRKKATFASNNGKSKMQQYACVLSKEKNSVYSPINGFTAADLGYQPSDTLSNLINKLTDTKTTQKYIQVFDQIWNDPEKVNDVTEIICSHIDTIYKENSPEKIYFLMLYNIFNKFLEDLDIDTLPNDRTGYKNSVIWNKLFNFQKDAATGLINKLEKYNGCILADSVGLGKTFTALAVIKYYELRNKSVLVLCPKKLADNWQTYKSNYKTNILAKDRLNYDLLFHTDLSRKSGYSLDIDLSKINWGNYDLIVIDESHNFRNHGRNLKDKESRYERLMNLVIKAGVKTKVLMLSATPVNNKFKDLKNQLALAYEGESEQLSEKLGIDRSIEDIFKHAQTVFNAWSKLPVEERTAQNILTSLDFDFFTLLDAVTIARSRRHIETFYDTSDIGQFPTRQQPLSFRLPVSHQKDTMSINDIYTHLNEIKQSVYAPMSYLFPSRISKYEELYGTETKSGRFKQADREKALKALMRTNLLKRLESSVDAFRLTLRKLEKRIGDTLNNIRQFEENGQEKQVFALNESELAELEFDEDFNNEEITTQGKVKIDFTDLDLPSWKRDLETDQTLIEMLLEEMDKILVADDAKLQHLIEHIQNKINNPINPNNKKVLIFTAFADTANYLYENLKEKFKNQNIDLAKINGSDSQTTLKGSPNFQDILCFFSPKSKDTQLLYPENSAEIDILIATDCISEGQNLQDCDYLINYDIHWNPVRIIQRFGRIDRIGSSNQVIQLVNYWPDISLDEYINLKERVESRMVIADMSATGDDNILTGKSNDISYRKEQLRKLQDEVIELEDLKTGVNITNLGLNDFRMDLLTYIQSNPDLKSLPNGLHAVLPASPQDNLFPGVIFTLKNINLNSNIRQHIRQHNRLHPYYLLYLRDDGEVIVNHTKVKSLLDFVRKHCKGKSKVDALACKLFNEDTDEGKNMQHYSDLLGQAIEHIIEIREEKDVDSLFSGTKTSALVHAIKGLEDFELISFLVIQAEEG